MRKFYIVLLVLPLVLVSLVSGVAAHSHVSSTAPGDGEKVQEPVESIEIVFDAGIEQATTIKVKDEAGNEVPLASENVTSPVYTATLEQPLVSGTYVVEWSAFGEDGHITEGSFTFSVEASEIEETEANSEQEAEVINEEEESTLTGEPNEEGNDPGEVPVAEELPEETEEKQSSLLIWIVIIGVALMIIILFFLLRR